MELLHIIPVGFTHCGYWRVSLYKINTGVVWELLGVVKKTNSPWCVSPDLSSVIKILLMTLVHILLAISNMRHHKLFIECLFWSKNPVPRNFLKLLLPNLLHGETMALCSIKVPYTYNSYHVINHRLSCIYQRHSFPWEEKMTDSDKKEYMSLPKVTSNLFN